MAQPVGIAAAIMIPALVHRQETRRSSYCTALAYYGSAIWPIAPAAANFFGPQVSAFAALALWAIGTAVLATPWAGFWSSNRKQLLWRTPIALAASVVPPLGIIGWASPLTAAGYLFPGTAWFGVLGCALGAGVLAASLKIPAVTIAAAALATNVVYSPPQSPTGWTAINTNFGAIAHSVPSPDMEYEVAEQLQNQALSSDASVIVFPETVAPFWTDATDLFWEPTLAALRARGKTILVGAKLPRRVSQLPKPLPFDFAAEIVTLQSGVTPVVPRAGSGTLDVSDSAYRNGVVVRGSEFGSFEQRVPVPFGMWKPFAAQGAPLNLSGLGVLRIGTERAAILICYEQLLTWPVLVSLVQHPTVIVAIANDYWVAGTPIPEFQLTAVHTWSRLFHLPCLTAVNR